MADAMTILLIGLNHKTAPVELREKLALAECAAGDLYHDLTRRPHINEAVLLSTCNRVEVLTVSDQAAEAEAEVAAFLAEGRNVAPEALAEHLYVYQDAEAVTHLFQVASSLDSMVVGEPQILGQLKEAYREAVNNKSAGAVLNKLLHKSFFTAKRVRSETGIASHAVSIGYAAVELARKIFGRLDDKRVMLVGAGEMAELTAEHLLSQGSREIVVVNRTLKRAMELAHRWNGQAAALGEIADFLTKVDIVISSTGSAETVIHADMVRKVMKARKHKPLFFVDIAVPRDVDPDVNRLGNIYLYDIDDLSAVVEENRAARQGEAARAQRIVEEETLHFLQWLQTLDAFPTIVALKEKADAIRQAELKKTLAKLDLDPQQLEALDVMTRAMMHKLLHDPILFVKAAGRHGRQDLNLEIARRIFGLDKDQSAEGLEEMDEEDAPISAALDKT
jgi:glutamyl-tRNA reductase